MAAIPITISKQRVGPHGRSGRSGQVGMVLAGVLALAFLGAPTPSAREGVPPLALPDAQVVTQSAEQVVFDVRFDAPTVRSVDLAGDAYLQVVIPGLTSSYEPGHPDLAHHQILVAVPPGTEPVASLIGGEEVLLARGRVLPIATERYELPERGDAETRQGLAQHSMTFREDPAIYDAGILYPRERVAAEPARRWRTLRVSAIRVSPLRYDAHDGAVYYTERMRVRVLFVPTGGARRDVAERPFVHAEDRWEPIYKRHLINYDSARGYKRLPLERRSLSRLQSDQNGLEFRVKVDSTRVYAVRFDDLARGGELEGPQSWDDVKLEVRDYDADDPQDPFQTWPIAYYAEDIDQDGSFGPGDRLIFYGQDAWDFFDVTPGEKRYLRRNVYWLVVGSGAGDRMNATPAWLDEDLPSEVVTYTRRQHFEQDRFYMSVLARSDIPNPQSGPKAFRTDHYNWTHPDWIEGTQARPIKVVSVDLPELLVVTDICVHLQGQVELSGFGSHHTRLWISNSSSPMDTAWAFPGNPYRVRELDDIITCVSGDQAAMTPLRTGRNYFKIYVPRVGDGIDDVVGDGLGIDWIEISYMGLTLLRNRELLMPLSGLTGPQQIRVSRCASTDMLAFDLTDARQPTRLALADSLFEQSGSHYNLRVQTDLGPTGNDRLLYFVERAHIPNIAADAISIRRGLRLDQFSNEDYVAIYPRRFEPQLLALLDHREAVSGHRVLRAPVEDVFDTYSGGRRHPFAIKRMLREMWRVGEIPPDYLLIVGDASNDIPGYTIGRQTWNADSNYVPVMTIAGHAAAGSAYQVVSSDHWFIDNLTGGWDDDMTMNPDMFVGRIPCGSPGEVALSVNKILDYELENHTGRWRGHVVMHADDAFSSRISGIGGSGLYTLYTSEWTFLNKCRESVGYIRSHPAFDHFVIDTLYQSAEMDSVPHLGRCVLDSTGQRCLRDQNGDVVLVSYPTEADQSANWRYGSSTVRDLLIDYLNEGALIWAYQGHSNHKLVAHELIFEHSITSSPIDRLSNIGKPFIFMGFGCHLGEYAHHQEGYAIRGDCMAERMLFCCGSQSRGAIAALGSTDYEWVHHTYQLRVFQTMFSQPPQSESGASRWRMGELTSEAKMLLRPNEEERITYTLLGDPGLRVGIAPPVLHVRLNDEIWVPEETPAYVSTRTDDSLTVRVQIYDESHLSTGQIKIKDYRDGVYDWVADSLLVLVESANDRELLVEYQTQLQRREYELLLQAADYEGSLRSVAAPVALIIGFFEEIDGSLIPLPESGAVISDSTRLVVTVRTSAHLEETGFRLEAGGWELPIAGSESSQEGGGGLYSWTVRYAATGSLPSGNMTLEFSIRQRDGTDLVVAVQPVEVGADQLRFRSQYWVPSPFTTATTLVYDLSLPATRARLRIYTVTGRRIFEDEGLPTRKGVNYFQWNGRDADGDAIANGLYFYEIAVWDDAGRRVQAIEKVVRAR